MTLTKSFEDQIEICAPRQVNLQDLLKQNSYEAFNSDVLHFIAQLGEMILADSESRKFLDVIAFAIWLRDMERTFSNKTEIQRKGRGIVFHITPGNVPINFAYSLITGLVTGNVNIVKLPSRKFEQVEFLLHKVNELTSLVEHAKIMNRFVLIRYPRLREINDFFSMLCDVRVIWGGNSSIHEIRKSPLPAKSFDITFSDRYSICVINSSEYLNSSEKVQIAQGFYNDTYLFDQNACTAPHLINWIGDEDESEKASKLFWENLEPLVSRRYLIEPLQIIDKLVMCARFSASHTNAKLFKSLDQKIIRFQLEEIGENLENYKSNSGLFYEIKLGKLEDITKYVNKIYQTMVYFGFSREQLESFVRNSEIQGIDRIVPVGKSLDFSFNWDGFNLIESLTRGVEVKF